MQRRATPGALSWHPSLTLFIALSALDAASTWLALQVGLTEGNPLPSMLLRAGGPSTLFAFKAGTILIVIAFMLGLGSCHPRLWRALRSANWFLFAVVLINVAQILATR